MTRLKRSPLRGRWLYLGYSRAHAVIASGRRFLGRVLARLRGDAPIAVLRQELEHLRVEQAETSVATQGAIAALAGWTENVEHVRAVLSQQGEDLEKQVVALSSRLQAAGDGVARLETRLVEVMTHLQRFEAESNDRQGALAAQLDAPSGLNSAVRNLQHEQARVTDEIGLVKGGLQVLRHRADQLERSQNFNPTTAQPAESPVARSYEIFDDFYLAFENEFRGTRDAILAKLSDYIPTIRDRGVGTAEAPVVDLGCGRGEWLEVLGSAGLTAYGIDVNETMVRECNARGLRAIQADGLRHLRSLPDESLGAVSAFHLVEHLALPDLLALLAECRRVLRPDGVLVLETPNPQNVIVGACNFYIDPTHRNPIPPMTLRFLAQYFGFPDTEVIPKNPFAPEHHFPAPRSETEEKLDQFFFGAQDYALIGRRGA